MSSMTCRGSDRTSRPISSSLSRKEAGSQRSKSREYERTAASPRVRISATISATVRRTCCRAFSSADAGRALFSSKAMAQLLHGVRGQTYVCSNPKLLCYVRQAEPSTVAMLSAPCSSPGGGHKEALDGHQPRGGSARRGFPTDGVPGLARQHQGVGADEATGTRSGSSSGLCTECHRPGLVDGPIWPARSAAHRSGEPVLPTCHGSDA